MHEHGSVERTCKPIQNYYNPKVSTHKSVRSQTVLPNGHCTHQCAATTAAMSTLTTPPAPSELRKRKHIGSAPLEASPKNHQQTNAALMRVERPTAGGEVGESSTQAGSKW